MRMCGNQYTQHSSTFLWEKIEKNLIQRFSFFINLFPFIDENLPGQFYQIQGRGEGELHTLTYLWVALYVSTSFTLYINLLYTHTLSL